MSEPVLKKSKFGKTTTYYNGGLALEATEQWDWQILGYNVIHLDESLINSEQLKIEIGRIGPDFPRSEWMFFLHTMKRPEDDEEKVALSLKLVQPKLASSSETEKKLHARFTVRIEKEDGSNFANGEMGLKCIDAYRKMEPDLGLVLFNAALKVSDLPLLEDDSLVIHVGLEIFSQNLRNQSDFSGSEHELVSNATRRRAALLESGDGADVTIYASDGTRFEAHKAFLMAESPVFRSMFLGGMPEQKTDELQVADLSGKAVNLLLRFIYTGEVPLFGVDVNVDGGGTGSGASKPCLSEVLNGAAKYQLEDLVEHIDNSMGKLCDEANTKFLLHLANKFGLQKAQRAVKWFIMCNPIVAKAILASV